jgi:hypothetical protein
VADHSETDVEDQLEIQDEGSESEQDMTDEEPEQVTENVHTRRWTPICKECI